MQVMTGESTARSLVMLDEIGRGTSTHEVRSRVRVRSLAYLLSLLFALTYPLNMHKHVYIYMHILCVGCGHRHGLARVSTVYIYTHMLYIGCGHRHGSARVSGREIDLLHVCHSPPRDKAAARAAACAAADLELATAAGARLARVGLHARMMKGAWRVGRLCA